MFMRGLLIAFFLFLSACSNVLSGALLLDQNGGGGSGVLEEPEAPVTFHPNEKPKHPASLEMLQSIFANLKVANTFLPEDAAYFSSIIVGDKARSIYSGSYDQIRALKKLGPEGRAFVKSILSYCEISPAKKIESGKNQPGNTVHTQIEMSSEGTSCGYVLKKSVQKSKVISAVTGDTKVANWSETITSKIEDRREVRDTAIKDLSKIVSFNFVSSLTGTVHYTATKQGFKIKVLFKGVGQANIIFKNGLELKGPVHSETVTEEDGKTMIKFRFLATTESGDILFLVLRDEKNSPKVYVNGEPTSSDILEVFGLNLFEVAAVR